MLSCFNPKTEKDIHWRTLMAVVESGGGEYVDKVMKTAKLVTKKRLDFSGAIEIVKNLTPEEGIALWDGWKEARKKAKGVGFGFVFGQSPQGFIGYAKTKYGFEPTLQESTLFRNAFFNLYQALPAWHERQKKIVHQDGFVRNMMGRKRRLPGIYSNDRQLVSECERQAINSPIQGAVGDLKAMILVQLMDTFDWGEFRIVGEVHDSILCWIQTSQLKNLLPQIHEIAEHPQLARECGLKFPIPMTVTVEVGPWGSGERWNP